MTLDDTCGEECVDTSCNGASPELDRAREPRQSMPWTGAIERVAESAPYVEVDRVPRRWDRLVRLVGNVGMQRLLGSHVMVVGLSLIHI